MLTREIKPRTVIWKERGLEEGRVEGRKEGETKLLKQLLTMRFGPLPEWVAGKFVEASAAEPECWAGRLFAVTRIEDLFDDGMQSLNGK